MVYKARGEVPVVSLQNEVNKELFKVQETDVSYGVAEIHGSTFDVLSGETLIATSFERRKPITGLEDCIAITIELPEVTHPIANILTAIAKRNDGVLGNFLRTEIVLKVDVAYVITILVETEGCEVPIDYHVKAHVDHTLVLAISDIMVDFFTNQD